MSSNSDLELECVAALIAGVAAAECSDKQKNVKKRRKTRKWLCRKNGRKGVLEMLSDELLTQDLASFRNYLRMDAANFDILLNLVTEDIAKQNTLMRDAVSAKIRLQITLRFLATGETYRSLMYSTRVHESTISRFVPEVCNALYTRLKGKYLKVPTTVDEWEKIASDLYCKWNFPNCIGALDGRHIKLKAPQNSGSYFYNYKGTNGIVLLALADANYKFTYVNVGVNGRISDGGVYRESLLSKAITHNSLSFPAPKELPGRTIKVPYVIVADDAFPLCENILKPYSGRNLSRECKIYNYRLSRARRMVESSFGILANRFRVLLNSINLSVEKVKGITLCCVALHNFLITNNATSYGVDKTNKNKVMLLRTRQAGNRNSHLSRNIRDEFKEFFNTVGAVDWQNDEVATNNM